MQLDGDKYISPGISGCGGCWHCPPRFLLLRVKHWRNRMCHAVKYVTFGFLSTSSLFPCDGWYFCWMFCPGPMVCSRWRQRIIFVVVSCIFFADILWLFHLHICQAKLHYPIRLTVKVKVPACMGRALLMPTIAFQIWMATEGLDSDPHNARWQCLTSLVCACMMISIM